MSETENESPQGILVGYARVSTEEQNLDLQRDALINAGVEEFYIFEEKSTGVHTKRPELTQCLRSLRKGDTLIVYRLDRLARSLADLMQMLDDFDKRGIKFKSLTEAIDTSGAMGRLVFHMIGAIAEFEARLISERTKAGLQAAALRGRKGGRKPVVTKEMMKDILRMLQDPSITHDDVSRVFKISRGAVYRALKRYRDDEEFKQLQGLLRKRTRANTKAARQRRLKQIENEKKARADATASGKLVTLTRPGLTADDTD